MAKKDNRYKFVYSPLFLGMSALFFLTTSLLLSGANYSIQKVSQISILTGFLETQYLSTTVSVLLTLAVTGVTASIIHILNYRHFHTGKDSLVLIFLYLIFLFSSPETIFFNVNTIAAPLFLLSLYYTINPANNHTNIFLASILISIATLFDFHLLALIPFIFYYSLIKSSFSIRSLIIFVGATILPYLFLFSIRYIVFEDASLYAQILWQKITTISVPHLNIDTVAHIILFAFSLYIAYRAVYSILNKLRSLKIIKATALLRFIVTAIVLTIIMLLNKEIKGEYMTLLAIPSAFIINEYLTSKKTDKNKRGEFLVLLIILTLSRVAEFM
ncbi:MAG: hypothetical protein PHE99_04575 [Bacteroidales bacterium]|nr:hypothetical protein [Bacteroidales bacterium]